MVAVREHLFNPTAPLHSIRHPGRPSPFPVPLTSHSVARRCTMQKPACHRWRLPEITLALKCQRTLATVPLPSGSNTRPSQFLQPAPARAPVPRSAHCLPQRGCVPKPRVGSFFGPTRGNPLVKFHRAQPRTKAPTATRPLCMLCMIRKETRPKPKQFARTNADGHEPAPSTLKLAPWEFIGHWGFSSPFAPSSSGIPAGDTGAQGGVQPLQAVTNPVTRVTNHRLAPIRPSKCVIHSFPRRPVHWLTIS
jgi:hypothetical protein